jgi:hypothetical protein
MSKTTAWQVLRRRVRMKPYNATLPNRWVGRAGAADEVDSSRELQMPSTTAWQVLRRRVRMKPYNATLPNRWVGRAGAAEEEWMKWPPPVSYRCRVRLRGKFCADGFA